MKFKEITEDQVEYYSADDIEKNLYRDKINLNKFKNAMSFKTSIKKYVIDPSNIKVRLKPMNNGLLEIKTDLSIDDLFKKMKKSIERFNKIYYVELVLFKDKNSIFLKI